MPEFAPVRLSNFAECMYKENTSRSLKLRRCRETPVAISVWYGWHRLSFVCSACHPVACMWLDSVRTKLARLSLSLACCALRCWGCSSSVTNVRLKFLILSAACTQLFHSSSAKTAFLLIIWASYRNENSCEETKVLFDTRPCIDCSLHILSAQK